MKAAVLFGNEDIRYSDWDKPSPGPGEVLVRVLASGICGSDVPRVLANGAHFYPVVLGHEFAGVIEETGEDVGGLKPGDHVSGAPLRPCMKCPDCARGNYSLCKHYSFIGSREQGSFAQYVVLPAVNAVKYSPSVPAEQAAMFEPSTVALHGIFLNGSPTAEYTAICGGGTIGMFTMQWSSAPAGRRCSTSFPSVSSWRSAWGRTRCSTAAIPDSPTPRGNTPAERASAPYTRRPDSPRR